MLCLHASMFSKLISTMKLLKYCRLLRFFLSLIASKENFRRVCYIFIRNFSLLISFSAFALFRICYRSFALCHLSFRNDYKKVFERFQRVRFEALQAFKWFGELGSISGLSAWKAQLLRNVNQDCATQEILKNFDQHSVSHWAMKFSPKEKGPFFSKFKFSLNGGDLVFCFAFNLGVHLEISSSTTY